MNPTPSPQRPRRTRREEGIALVTVLAILTLTAVLVMAFFSISRSELASATVYSRGVEASHLSKTAVDMVIHQIRSATEQRGIAWASQPGMVRTWNSQGEQRGFKLYSDDQMVVPEQNVFADAGELQNWRNDVRFVDLNAPVIRTYDTSTSYFYPIIDPRAATGAGKVEGFDVNFSAVGASPASNTLPMPVKWIYQLEDGTLGTLMGSGATGRFQPLAGQQGGTSQPSGANPIVARFAFWADDESAKLNVNTAAGGVAWDTPRAGGVSDRAYGMFQPVANEFQRYPAHPATTSMMHVLFPGIALPNSERYDRLSAEAYYELVPRVESGGSKGGGFAGTNNQYGLILPIQPDKDRLYATIDEFIFRAPQVGRRDGTTGANFQREEQRRVGVWPELSPIDLGRLQFFLTATSKAPEVTIFNTPRISVWPSFHGNPELNVHARYFTSYDQRLRFCAQIGTRASEGIDDVRAPKFRDSRGRMVEPAMYHFQRKNAMSTTADYATIPRNQELYAYLQALMSAPVPGMDVSDGVQNWGSFAGKYGQRNTDQIITQVFDYIRSLNLFDDLLMKQHNVQRLTTPRLPSAPAALSRNFASNGYFGYWPPRAEPNVPYNPGDHPSFTPGRLSIYNPPDLNAGHSHYIGADTHTGHGQVAPIVILPPDSMVPSKGLGRFFSVREVGIAILTCAQDNGFPGGLARPCVGIRNLGSLNESWGTDNPAGLRAVHEGRQPPPWDFSNVPPLTMVTPEHVYTVYQLGRYGLESPDDLVAGARPVNLGGGPPPMTGPQFFRYVTDEVNWNRTLAPDQPLTGGETQVQAMLLVSLFCPSKGWTLINPDFRLMMDVQEDFSLNGVPLQFNVEYAEDGTVRPRGRKVIRTPHAAFRRVWGGRDNGGMLEPRMLLIGHGRNTPAPAIDRLQFGLIPRSTSTPLRSELGRALMNVDRDARNPPFRSDIIDEDEWKNERSMDAELRPMMEGSSYQYPWVSPTITIPGTGSRGMFSEGSNAALMQLGGGRVVIELYPDGGSRTNGVDQVAQRSDVENPIPAQETRIAPYCQRVEIDFADTTVPVPILAGAAKGWLREGPRAGNWTAVPGTELRPRQNWCWNRDGAFKSQAPGIQPSIFSSGDHSGRLRQIHGHRGDAIARDEILSFAFDGHGIVRPVDVVRSYVIPHGDDRIVAAMRDVPDGVFQKHLFYDRAIATAQPRLVASNFTIEYGNQGYGREGLLNNPANARIEPKALVDPVVANVPRNRRPLLPDNFNTDQNGQPAVHNLWGDWDNGVASELDGPYINKPDEGNAMGVAYSDFIPKPWISNSPARQFIPYFTDSWVQEPAGPGLWSPNRIMPGPGMFGSLPTGVYDRNGNPGGQPWQTLLFRRIGGDQRQSRLGHSPKTGQVHPGWQHPRDHYILDFFWMPVVEPYSISEPLATAGKVNMNYAIQPFHYIKRKSSMLGVFASEELLTVPNRLRVSNNANDANGYKEGEGWGTGFNRTTNQGGTLRNVSLRSWINLDETLRQFDAVFGGPGGGNQNNIFRTPSQLCEQWLVPGRPVRGNPYGVANIRLEDVGQWYNPDYNSAAGDRSFGLVGDNVRERPYTNIVSRLTTKSNTFNVHYRAQIVRQSPLSPTTPGMRRSDAEFAIFDSTMDKMVGEYRGSTIIERYVDPNDARIPDYASLASRGRLNLGTPGEVDTLDKFYRFRVVSEKRFAP
jgi:hypothetical protein